MKYKFLFVLEFIKSFLALLFVRAARRVVLIGTPLHGNLGDHAIALALCDYFRQNGVRYVEITGAVYRKFPRVLNARIRKSDTICICGGGFLGSLWTAEDDMVLSVLEKFKSNKIVIAPQSVFFYENDSARIERTKCIYGNCKDLSVFLRERNSYELVKNLLSGTGVKISLVPDIVFRLDTRAVPKLSPNGKILLCFRTDKEKIISDEQKSRLVQRIRQSGFEYEEIDTVLPHNVPRCMRKKEVYALLAKIRAARLVIADRLHAMLFAYITETPCYVFDNISRKVSGVYKWITDAEYIRYCAAFDESAIDFDLLRGKRKNFSAEFAPLFAELEHSLSQNGGAE